MLCPDRLNPHDFPSPCFVTDLAKLEKNMQILNSVQKNNEGKNPSRPQRVCPVEKLPLFIKSHAGSIIRRLRKLR